MYEGDKDGIANTLWSIACIDFQQQRWQDAFERLEKSYAINLELGRLDGICFVGLDFGRLLCAAGNREQGLKILHRSCDGFAKLDRQDMAQQAKDLMDRFSQ